MSREYTRFTDTSERRPGVDYSYRLTTNGWNFRATYTGNEPIARAEIGEYHRGQWECPCVPPCLLGLAVLGVTFFVSPIDDTKGFFYTGVAIAAFLIFCVGCYREQRGRQNAASTVEDMVVRNVNERLDRMRRGP